MTSWLKPQVVDLIRLWNEGHRASEIATRIGVTKNAVVGKAHRLHLTPRPSPIRRAPARVMVPVFHRLNPPAPKGPLRRDFPEKPTAPVLQRLPYYKTLPTNGHACEFMNGEKPDYKPCGAPAVVGYPFCPEHCARAYLAPRKRREGLYPGATPPEPAGVGD